MLMHMQGGGTARGADGVTQSVYQLGTFCGRGHITAAAPASRHSRECISSRLEIRAPQVCDSDMSFA